MALKMPMISNCEVTNCSYNADNKCHTMAITVGDTACAMCDTFTKLNKKGGDPSITGGVGACKAENCKFNQSLECSANSIAVGMHSNHADCKTFVAR